MSPSSEDRSGVLCSGLHPELAEQARNGDHDSSDPCSQAKKQQKVTQEHRHVHATPLLPVPDIFVGTGRNGNSLSIMGHESLQTSYPKMPALNSERSRSFGVNEAVARSAQDWRGFFVNFIPPPAFCKRAHGGLARRGALRRLANDVMLSKQG
jgi:hypothetical protein